MTKAADSRDLARLSLAETIDALQVLSEGALAADSDPAIRSARVKLLVARVALGVAQHLTVSRAVDNLLRCRYTAPARSRVGVGQPEHVAALLPQLNGDYLLFSNGYWP